MYVHTFTACETFFAFASLVVTWTDSFLEPNRLTKEAANG
jgi:hypothetical protein